MSKPGFGGGSCLVSAALGRSQEAVVELLVREESIVGGLAGKAEFGMGAGQELGVAVRLEIAHEGRADETAVAGDVDFRVQFQVQRSKFKVQFQEAWPGADSLPLGGSLRILKPSRRRAGRQLVKRFRR